VNIFKKLWMKWELEIEIDRLAKIIRKESSEDHQQWLRKVSNSDPVLGVLLSANDIVPALMRRHRDMRAAHAHLSKRQRRRSAPVSLPPIPPLSDLPPLTQEARRGDGSRFPGV